SPATLRRVFSHYGKKYGPKKCAYARKAYPLWKSGKRFLSGDVCERLLAIVPRHLSFSAKYELVVKLWMRHNDARVRFEVKSSARAEEAVADILRTLDTLRLGQIPKSIVTRLSWLAEGDAVAADALFREVRRREHAQTRECLRQEIEKLLQLRDEVDGSA